MEQDKNTVFQDTIDLDEIREMLGNREQSEAQSAVEEELAKADEKPSDEKKEKKGKKEKKPGEELYGVVHDLVWIVAAVTVIFVFFVRLVGVDGKSMLPTLYDRDFLLLESNFLYGTDDIEPGDIVVMNVPYYKDKGLIVKRVIAVEGQTVDIDFVEGVVYVDGVLLTEPYVNTPTNANWPEINALEYPVVVPEGCIFVLGDNRNDSTDSRYAPVGMIDCRCVLGKVQAIVMPGELRDDFGNLLEEKDWSRIGLVS